MKKKMMTLAFTFCVVFCAAMIGLNSKNTLEVEGASITKQAKTAYKTYLGQSVINWKPYNLYSYAIDYCIVDLNKDKVPELIVKYKYADELANRVGYGEVDKYRIYTYKKGKMKIALTIKDDCEKMEYYPKKNMVVAKYTHSPGKFISDFYVMNSKGRFKLKAEKCADEIGETEAYYMSGKNVSKTKFKSFIKSQAGSVKSRGVTFKINTY